MLQQQLHSISLSRLSPYLTLCGNNQKEAVCVYTALQQRSCIYFALIQEIEVGVRNEMSRVIQSRLSPQQDLLGFFQSLAADTSSLSLSAAGRKQLADCLRELSVSKPNFRADDVIANITFGFWVHLLNDDGAKNPDYAKWHQMFNGQLFGKRFASNKDIFLSLRQVLSFRNKLYHQEPVWKGKSIRSPEKALRNLSKKYQNFSCYLQKIAPERAKLRQASPLLRSMEAGCFDETLLMTELNYLKTLL